MMTADRGRPQFFLEAIRGTGMGDETTVQETERESLGPVMGHLNGPLSTASLVYNSGTGRQFRGLA